MFNEVTLSLKKSFKILRILDWLFILSFSSPRGGRERDFHFMNFIFDASRGLASGCSSG